MFRKASVVLLFGVLCHAAGAADAPETIAVRSGALKLGARVWRPQGDGPHPAILFLHGSGISEEERVERRIAEAQILGPVFAEHGVVFMALFRRGEGLSAEQGEAAGVLRERVLAAKGADAANDLQ